MLQTKRSVKNLNGDEEMELAKLVDELDGMDSEISLDEPKEGQEKSMDIARTSSPTPLPAAYQSPTLINLPSTKLPKKDFACMYCPAGMWALKGDALLCFCRMMSSVSYTSEEGDERPVWLCDGLTLAQEGAM